MKKFLQYELHTSKFGLLTPSKKTTLPLKFPHNLNYTYYYL